MDESKHHAAQHETIPKQDQIQAAGDHQGRRDQPSPEAPPQRALRKRKGGGKEDDDGAEQGEAAAEKQNVDSTEAHGIGGGGEGAAAAAGADTAAGEKRAIPDAVIEEGRLYMFYRPKVQVEDVKGMGDVQRFYMVMDPLSPAGHKARLIVVPKKRLPSQSDRDKGHERFYGFVEATAPREAGGEEGQGGQGGAEEGQGEGGLVGAKALVARLGGKEYETKTQGTRHQGAARVLAEAAYVIGKGGKRGSTHLAYKLEVPNEPGPAQQLFRVEREGELLVSIKNPENRPPGAPTAGPAPAMYDEQQSKRLKGYAWVGVEDSSMLDVNGAELLLIGAALNDPIGHLGEAGAELMEVYYSDTAEESVDVDKVRSEIEPGAAQKADALPVEPAATGQLV